MSGVWSVVQKEIHSGTFGALDQIWNLDRLPDVARLRPLVQA